MRINKYCSKPDLEYYKQKYSQYISLFETPNDDSLFKNLSILDFVINVNANKDIFIDCGSGPSPLSYLLCDYFKDGFMIDKSVKNKFKKSNLHHNIGDFFNFLIDFEDYSIDFALDGCSLTHFGYDEHSNWGLKKTSELFSKKIKKGGFFVMSTDVLSHNSNNNYSQHEFIKVNDIIEIFNKVGFDLISEFDYSSIDDDFKIDLDYHGKFRLNLYYCNLVFKKVYNI